MKYNLNLFSMSQRNMLSLFLIAGFLLVSCQEQPVTDLKKNALIPKPLEVVAGGGIFKLNARTRIGFNQENTLLTGKAELLQSLVSEITDFDLETENAPDPARYNRIYLILNNNDEFGSEGYAIMIEKRQIIISAMTPEGLFRGITTFGQLLSLEGSEVEFSEKYVSIPTGMINDRPEFEYRGAMLDVARHFFPADVVKKFIDRISLYKINTLHLHLSDDQGWRIEIKSWPKLTEIGGSTEVGGGPGGFYTQEEYKDIVNYASERYITIVPEIDMPGHTNAALASYPELNCDGKARDLYTGTRVGFSTLCTHKEITYQFVDDVVREISGLTPGSYFHMGGDESHVTELDDYIYFVNRVKEIIAKHGKTMVGWDEISHAGIEQGDIAQYWSSAENAKRTVEKGAKLIFSPAQRCYLDMKYDSTTSLGLNWAAYIEVDDAYNWNPGSLVDGISREHILGIESPLWGETIETLDDIDYLAFPRLIGHAEIGWSQADSLSWDDYRQRLSVHGKLLDKIGVNYYHSPLVWSK